MQNKTLAPRQRPLGVTIIAILMALQGVLLFLISAIGFFVFLAALSTNHDSPLTSVIIVGTLGSVLLLVSMLSLLVAWGLWMLKRWAFWFTVITQLVSLLSSVGMLIQTGNSMTTATTSNIVFAIVILIYLFADRNVRVAFRT